MFSDAYNFLAGFFSLIWRFFTSLFLPGTQGTPAHFLIGRLFVCLMLFTLFRLIDHRRSGESGSSDSK